MSANNCKCKEHECQEYCDCSGNTFCICKEIEPVAELPVLIAPLPFNATWGHDTYYRGKLERDVYKKKGIAYAHIKRPLKVGDIVQLSGSCIQYFLKKKLRRKDFYNNFVFEILRVDGIRMSYLDLNQLTKGKELLVKGYFADKKDNH